MIKKMNKGKLFKIKAVAPNYDIYFLNITAASKFYKTYRNLIQKRIKYQIPWTWDKKIKLFKNIQFENCMKRFNDLMENNGVIIADSIIKIMHKKNI